MKEKLFKFVISNIEKGKAGRKSRLIYFTFKMPCAYMRIPWETSEYLTKEEALKLAQLELKQSIIKEIIGAEFEYVPH